MVHPAEIMSVGPILSAPKGNISPILLSQIQNGSQSVRLQLSNSKQMQEKFLQERGRCFMTFPPMGRWSHFHSSGSCVQFCTWAVGTFPSLCLRTAQSRLLVSRLKKQWKTNLPSLRCKFEHLSVSSWMTAMHSMQDWLWRCLRPRSYALCCVDTMSLVHRS